MNFQTILDPPILFFCLGVLAVFFRSNIEVPSNTTRFLSYYLLMSIGFKGGMALSKSTFTHDVWLACISGIVIAILIPFWIYFVLRRRLNREDAAAAAACYGSVSAVTFVTGISWLENQGLSYGGHMVALLALMEGPAIIIGLILAKLGAKEKSDINLKHILHDAFFNGSVFLLMGSLLIGYFTAPAQTGSFHVFIYDIFKGFLSFFLLDLGITAAKQVKQLKGDVILICLTAVLAPLANGLLGLFVARQIGMDANNGFLFIILCASASYIAVPAALKMALPNARSGIYLSMSLGLTFPFNILFGLSIYWSWATRFLSS